MTTALKSSKGYLYKYIMHVDLYTQVMHAFCVQVMKHTDPSCHGPYMNLS